MTNDEIILDYQNDDIPPYPSKSSLYTSPLTSYYDDYNDIDDYEFNNYDGIGHKIFVLLARFGNWLSSINNLIINLIILIVCIIIWPLGLFFLFCLVCHLIEDPNDEVLIKIGLILILIGIILVIYLSIK